VNKIFFLKGLKVVLRTTSKLNTYTVGDNMGEARQALTNPANGAVSSTDCPIHLEPKQDIGARVDKTVSMNSHAMWRQVCSEAPPVGIICPPLYR
jgi:hypothetical protein